MIIEPFHVPLDSCSLGTWMIVTQGGFLRGWDVAAEVQMPFIWCILVLVLADQSDQEVAHGFIAARCVGSETERRFVIQIRGSCSRPAEATSQHTETSNLFFLKWAWRDRPIPGLRDAASGSMWPKVHNKASAETLREPKSKFSTEISAR